MVRRSRLDLLRDVQVMQIFFPSPFSLDDDHFMHVYLRGIDVKGDPRGFHD